MSNLTKGTRRQPYGKEGRLVTLPVQALAQIWEGAMVSQIAGACCTATTALAGHVIGVAAHDMLGLATDGAVRLSLMTDQIFIFNAGSLAPTDATSYGTPLFAETDNTVGTGNGTQTTIAGRFMGIEDDGRVRVYVSNQASWFDTAAAPDGGTTPFKARAVVTTLQAYGGTTTGILTETSNGAISAADGVTLAVGDVVFLEEGTTNLTAASDAGPYVVTALGGASAKWVLTRPSWYETGAVMVPGQTIAIGGEGTLKGGTSWKTFAVKGKVIDTDAPLFWVDRVLQAVTLGAGTVTISNVGVRSASKSNVAITRTATGGTVSTTVEYCPTVAGATGLTVGAIGTGSVVIQATVAAGTIQNADTSVLNVMITNW